MSAQRAIDRGPALGVAATGGVGGATSTLAGAAAVALGFVKTMGASDSTRGIEGLPKRIGGVPLGAVLTGLVSLFSAGRATELVGAGLAVAAAFLSVACGSPAFAAPGAGTGRGLGTATGSTGRASGGVGVTGAAGPGAGLGIEGASGALETASASGRVKVQSAAAAASTKAPKLSHKAQFTLCLLLTAGAKFWVDCFSAAIGKAACAGAAAGNNEGMAVRSATGGRGGKGAGIPTLSPLSGRAAAPERGANPAPEPGAPTSGEGRGTNCVRG